MKKIYTCIVFCFLMAGLSAQWTNNTAENLLVAKTNSSDIQVANTNDGRTWIAFYSQRGSNYDMRAQLLDANGNRLLGDSGILVSRKRSGTATFVFNVCTDRDNFLIIASQVESSSGYECGIQRISTDGKLLWGHGVDLGPGLSPYPVALTTNEIAVAWNNNGKIDFQKLSPAGIPAWSPYKEFAGANNRSVSRAQVIENTNGSFSFVYQEVFAFPFYTNLFEQRYDNNGDAVWKSAVKISNLTTVTYRYYDVHSDKDTTYIGYYGNPSGSNRFDAYIQRINKDGTMPWGINGVAFSDYSGNNDPMEQTIYIAKAPDANTVWAVCTITNPLQTASGIYAQKIDVITGTRYLGNFAKEIVPVSYKLSSLAFCKLSLCGNEPIFLATNNSNELAAIKLNTKGNFDWTPHLRVLGSTSNSKFRYGFTDFHNKQAVAVWQEDRGNGDMPYAQNIRCNGTTGTADPISNLVAKYQIQNSLAIKNIIPNPVRNSLTASISLSKQSNAHIYITDVSGNVLKEFSQQMNAGSNSVQLNVSNLKTGTYFIKVINENASAVAMFSKE